MKVNYVAKVTFEYKKKTYLQGQVVEGVTPEIEEYLKPFEVLEISDIEDRPRTAKTRKIKASSSENPSEENPSEDTTDDDSSTENQNNGEI